MHMTDEDALVEELARVVAPHVCHPVFNGDTNDVARGQDKARSVARAILPIVNARLDAVTKERDALKEALAKSNTPTWFYHPDHTEMCQWSPHDVVDDYYDPEPGEYVFEVECAKPLPSIWCAVRVTADEDADERFTLTEHATEEEARQALGGNHEG